MKLTDMPVKSLRCHVAIQVGKVVKEHIDAEASGVELHMVPMGISIDDPMSPEIKVITYNNIREFTVIKTPKVKA